MTGRAVGFWLGGTGERSSYEQRGLVSMRPVIVPPADPGVVQVIRSHWVCEEPPARHGAGGHEMAFVHQRLLSVHQPDYSSLRRNAREASAKSAAASRSDVSTGQRTATSFPAASEEGIVARAAGEYVPRGFQIAAIDTSA